ncbi:MAG: Uma2 family endonuclease [Gammaproteobacteria bacterium]|nr:Uma2 family endonuclease [Gammaproteobacteria bacterium]
MAETSFPGGATAIERTVPSAPGSEPPLSVIHARALYEPVPPVEYDEDGYPYSDGHFEMEGDFHSGPLRAVLDALRAIFDGRDDMYFAADMGLFFEKGNRRAVVVPDLVVVFGAARRSRNSFKLWQEPKAPDFVMEVISDDSLRNDMEYKPPLYAALGVTEYWTFDSLGRIPTPIIARRLGGAGTYEAIPRGLDGSYHSDVLGFDLRADPSGLGVRDTATGECVFDPGTLARLRQAAETRAERAEARADDADARVANAEQRAHAAEERESKAAAQAKTAEARVAELEQLLRQSRRR